MQTDVAPTTQDAATITTAQTLDAINKQIAQNQKDLPVAIQANALAGSGDGEQGAAAANALLGVKVTSSATPAAQTLSVALGAAAATTTSATAKTTTKAAKGSKATGSAAKGGNNNNNGKANNGNDNAAADKGNKNNKRGLMRFMRRDLEGHQ